MKQILFMFLLAMLSTTAGCGQQSRGSIEIEIPSRSEWEQSGGYEKPHPKITAPLAREYIVKWVPPANDILPKYAHVHTPWGDANVELNAEDKSFLIHPSMFQEPHVTPYPFFIIIVFANEISIFEDGVKWNEVYCMAEINPKEKCESAEPIIIKKEFLLRDGEMAKETIQ